MEETLKLRGWMEYNGEILSTSEIEKIFLMIGDHEPTDIDSKLKRQSALKMLSSCGGEFLVRYNNIMARDRMGLIQSSICNAGEIILVENNLFKSKIGEIDPLHSKETDNNSAELTTKRSDNDFAELESAIKKAVSLRKKGSVVAFSGGVDSALLAKLSGCPCISVGLFGSHDLCHARDTAAGIGIDEGITNTYVVKPEEIKEALKKVLTVIPDKSVVNASIAATMYFVTKWAAENGYERVMAGQGADELFGGYARYREASSLQSVKEILAADYEGLKLQTKRDQNVAEMNGVYLTCPYLDYRVVRAARCIDPSLIVHEGIAKYPLRKVASAHMDAEFAYYGKKAMQYGSGVMKEIQKRARDNGYKNSLQLYIDNLTD